MYCGYVYVLCVCIKLCIVGMYVYVRYIGRYVCSTYAQILQDIRTYAYVFYNTPRVQIFAMYFCVALKLACRFH